ncbi:putative tRNA methyl transferase [Trypanosoma vivax]|uniref:Putative tRNA-methyl transferase n=1 Tax=Trypanosoma vivax (strain Y486) TaxID=1055687 RepID=G0U0B6_TRYVY|nr:putative tRNA-methyl transferase [Trypanosoma vivax]KAH8613811.1 putative tRNA methyl transferase [Trypanosoma vivax]CCC49514.1 putative tRNA-methyl transferase [Trypanosoma vivax Y486]
MHMSHAPVRVAVALSGGVDSAVSALFLRRCVKAWRDVEALWDSPRPLLFREVREALEKQWSWADFTAHGRDTLERISAHDPASPVHYHPLYMRNWEETSESTGGSRWCTAAQQDYYDATDVARLVGILSREQVLKLYDCSSCYMRTCFEPMLDAYAQGITLNVDVLCNAEVKFRALFDILHASGVAQYIATGHYARTVALPWGECDSMGFHPSASSSRGSEQPMLPPTACRVVARPFTSGYDLNDQTLFLSRLTQEQISRALFPLGHVFQSKKDVRAIAALFGLGRIGRRKTSTGLCFVGECYGRKGGNVCSFSSFLEEYIAPNQAVTERLLATGSETLFLDAENEKKICPSSLQLPKGYKWPKHCIFPAYYFTLGQRLAVKGCTGSTKQYYVQRKLPFSLKSNEGENDNCRTKYLRAVWLVNRWDHPLLHSFVAQVHDVFVPLQPACLMLLLSVDGNNSEEKCDMRLHCYCCSRHQDPLYAAVLCFALGNLRAVSGGLCICKASVLFAMPVRALTSGQALVAYRPLADVHGASSLPLPPPSAWFVVASGWIT